MHHYSSKAELFVAAVRHLADRRETDLRRRAAELDDDEDRVSQAIDLLWEAFSGPLFTATLELWSASRTDPELHDAVRECERELRQDLSAVLTELFGPVVTAKAGYGAAMELTLQFLRGAALTSILRTDTGRQRTVVEEWKKAFSLLLASG